MNGSIPLYCPEVSYRTIQPRGRKGSDLFPSRLSGAHPIVNSSALPVCTCVSAIYHSSVQLRHEVVYSHFMLNENVGHNKYRAGSWSRDK
jgi:hypothetical protein